MTIKILVQFLRALEQPLRANGDKNSPADLAEVCAGLLQFEELSTSQFVEFLKTADHYRRTGEVPVGSKKPAKKVVTVDEEKIQDALRTVEDLYERATHRDLDYATIDARLKQVGKALTAPEVIELAKSWNIVKPVGTKAKALEEIKTRIFDRKQTFERTQRSG